MEPLERCHICNNYAKLIEQIPPEATYYSKICFKIRCTKCGESTAWHDTPDEASYLWNKRENKREGRNVD